MDESEKTLRRLFNEAIELSDSAERAAFLKQACGPDADLLRRVEDLLRAHKKADGFLDRPALPVAPGTIRVSFSSLEQSGDKIGPYKLLEQIGEGGCGVVYVAEQQEPVHRRVALKVIKLGMDTRHVVARFEAERQALALMDHPNIAKVLDAGATEEGRPYFVMELVKGVRITDYCDRSNLSTAERLGLFIQVCQAIQHAHQKGIIHRDIKPSNILVTLHDGVPVPKVIDFGIAKATSGQRLTDKTLYTAVEQFIGTPAYMSPEQAELSGLDIDTRSDIYALGVLLYELLTGKTPFDARRLVEAGLDEIRRIIREEEPPRPSTRISTLDAEEQTTLAKRRQSEPPKLLGIIRGDLDWIVMKTLEKDRTRRYETANGLAMDIQRYLNNEPVAARPPSNVYRFRKMVRRNKLVVVASGAIAIALVAGLAVSMWGLVKEQQARREADRQRQQSQANEKKAQAEAGKSRQVAQFLKDMLNGVGPSVALGRDTTLLKEILDSTAKRVGTDLTNQPEVEAELQYTLGEVYWELSDLEKAEATHRAALALRTSVFGNKDPQVAQSMRRLGHVLWRRGRLDEAEKMARDGVAMQRQLSGNRALELARSLGDLAAILNTKDELEDAGATMREALAIKEDLLGHDNLEVADTIDDLAAILARQGKGTHPSPEALAIRKKVLGADNPLVVMASLRLQAVELENQGNLVEAEMTLSNNIAAQRKIYGNEHPELAKSFTQLAMVLRKDHKLAEAVAARREALAIQRKCLGDDSAEVAQTLSNLGGLLVSENKLSEAESAHREALKIRRKVFGSDSLSVDYSLANLGVVLENEGRFEEARALLLEVSKRTNAAAALADYSLGFMYHSGTGVPWDAKEAAKWYRKAAELGNGGAQYGLALFELDGTAVPKDEVEAAKWLQQAADHGHYPAQNVLGWLYATGTGVPKDMEQSVKWYTSAAVHGAEYAQLRLGFMYEFGLGVNKNLAETARWYRKAAGQGNLPAQYRLAGMYESGRGVPKDNKESTKWYSAAIRKGDKRIPEQGGFVYDQYLASIHEEDVQAINDFAWKMATSGVPEIRNGTNAVVFATKAVKATERKNASYLGTLAAAYAEANQFDEAVAIQQEAINLLKSDEERKNFASRLKMYESKAPYREP